MIHNQYFHIQLYCQGSEAPATEGEIVYNGQTLRRSSAPQRTDFFPVSFESLMETMFTWPGVYAEWDGSWSWTCPDKDELGRPLWRLEGMIYDRDQRVFYIDMQGNCTRHAWQQLVDAFKLPDTMQLAICLTHEGAWIDRSSFEAWLPPNTQ